MPNYNKVILMGNVTRDPELRSTQGGMKILKLGLAINRKQKDKPDSTCFVDLTAFGKSAEVLEQYVQKGDPLLVDGRLDFSTWETDDGKKRSKLDVIIENFQLMPRRERDSTSSPPDEVDRVFEDFAERTDFKKTVAEKEDLPF